MKKRVRTLICITAIIFSIFAISCDDSGSGKKDHDSTPPEWAVSYPATVPMASRVYMKARLNERGNVYCVVVPDGSTAPSPEQVKNGQDSSGTPVTTKASGAANNTAVSTLMISGLDYSTDYDLYYIADDDSSNIQTAVTHHDFSTGVQDTLFVSTSGSDSDGGTIEDPKLTITGAIASVSGSITKIYVSAGTYNESVTLANGISLYGGYNATDWSDRRISDAGRNDPVYRTFIHSGAAQSNGIAVTGTYVGDWIIEGFTVQSGHIANSHGINVTAAATTTIRYNTINGGSGSNESNAIYIHLSNTKTIISNNSINGGSSTGASSNGLYIETAADQIITDNTINGGSGNNISRGITATLPLASSSLIARNTIHGGTNPDTTTAIYLINFTDGTSLAPVIHSNDINGGSGSFSYGIYCDGTADTRAVEPEIYNNVINGSADGNTYTFGIYFNNVDGSPLVYNNTICPGNASDQAYGIYSVGDSDQPSNPDVRNNIIFGNASANTTFGLYENSLTYGDYTHIQNNDIYGCNVLISSNGTPYNDIGDLNALRSHTDANIDANPALAADWNLTASTPVSVSLGGLDLSGIALFPENAGTKIDKAGNNRTAPWSMGAYERN